ncbi:MAG TPA: FtsX-like permease family protein, partial [Longimicrobiales bacterium]|nr:FtsX-like permease family protein [Longimicrobiales bacterium]
RMVDVGIDGRVAGFAGALVLATTFLVGVVPAIRLAARPAMGVLGGELQGGEDRPGGGRGRTLLLVPQVALSLVLLSGAALLFRGSRRLQELDPGFDPDGVLTFDISLPPSRYAGTGRRIRFFRALEERLSADPRVEAVGAALGSPLGADVAEEPLQRLDHPVPRPLREPAVVRRTATPGYFRTLRIPLLEGRLFDERDGAGDPGVVVVSRATALRFWPDGEPLGREVILGGASGLRPRVVRVVGVVDDVRSLALNEEPRPEVYVPFAQNPVSRLTVHVRALPGTGGTDGLVAVVRSQVLALDADLPLIGMDTLQGRVRTAGARSRFYLTLVGFFAVTTVALAAVGLYGVVAYLASRRRREIGIRMALGAEDHHVVQLVAREGFLAALGGIALGATGALVLARMVPGPLQVDVSRTVGVVSALVLGVVVAASVAPARGAGRTPPSDSLRTS